MCDTHATLPIHLYNTVSVFIYFSGLVRHLFFLYREDCSKKHPGGLKGQEINLKVVKH